MTSSFDYGKLLINTETHSSEEESTNNKLRREILVGEKDWTNYLENGLGGKSSISRRLTGCSPISRALITLAWIRALV